MKKQLCDWQKAADIMGFDDWLYVVTAYDDDGTIYEYEYGSYEKAKAHFEDERQAVLRRYSCGRYEELSARGFR